MGNVYCLDRALIRVSGPEARSFLNNLLTQDIDRLDAAGVQYAALLSPQGKVIADMFVWADGDDNVIIEADPARSADVLRRLTMYKLRSTVELEEITGRSDLRYSPAFFAGGTPDPRFPNGELGWRELSPLPADQTVESGTEAYEAHRLALGIPDLARDAAVEEVFALEVLLEELNGVDFQKGCFIGQENVSRMKRRATTRKKFCPVIFDGAPPTHGAPIKAGDADIGTIRTGTHGRAMALVRLDRAREASDAGLALKVESRVIELDPPAWLILPGPAGDGD